MSLIKCGECGARVSSSAYTCPVCGRSVNALANSNCRCGTCVNYGDSDMGWCEYDKPGHFNCCLGYVEEDYDDYD